MAKRILREALELRLLDRPIEDIFDLAKMEGAIFLDRDGTLIEEREYLRDPDLVTFISGAVEALAVAQRAGFALFIVTNQSGIGRGYFTQADLDRVHNRIERELASREVSIQKIYVAPEHPASPSRGRKPSPAFLYDARDEFGISLSDSYLVGDKLSDLECGWNAGLRASILVRTGYGRLTERELPSGVTKTVITNDLPEAIKWILSAPSRSAAC